jgi:hypothetical protein
VCVGEPSSFGFRPPRDEIDQALMFDVDDVRIIVGAVNILVEMLREINLQRRRIGPLLSRQLSTLKIPFLPFTSLCPRSCNNVQYIIYASQDDEMKDRVSQKILLQLVLVAFYVSFFCRREVADNYLLFS